MQIISNCTLQTKLLLMIWFIAFSLHTQVFHMYTALSQFSKQKSRVIRYFVKLFYSLPGPHLQA